MLLKAKHDTQLWVNDPIATTPAPTISLVKGNVVEFIGRTTYRQAHQGYILVQTSDERQHLAFAPHFEVVQG